MMGYRLAMHLPAFSRDMFGGQDVNERVGNAQRLAHLVVSRFRARHGGDRVAPSVEAALDLSMGPLTRAEQTRGTRQTFATLGGTPPDLVVRSAWHRVPVAQWGYPLTQMPHRSHAADLALMLEQVLTYRQDDWRIEDGIPWPAWRAREIQCGRKPFELACWEYGGKRAYAPSDHEYDYESSLIDYDLTSEPTKRAWMDQTRGDVDDQCAR